MSAYPDYKPTGYTAAEVDYVAEFHAAQERITDAIAGYDHDDDLASFGDDYRGRRKVQQ